MFHVRVCVCVCVCVCTLIILHSDGYVLPHASLCGRTISAEDSRVCPSAVQYSNINSNKK